MEKNVSSSPKSVETPTPVEGTQQEYSPPKQLLPIRPPFPPTISVEDLIISRPNGEKPSKASNAFMIYRKAYVRELHSRGINLQMTQISPIVSESWKKEPEGVKEEYKRLAEAAKKRYKEIWPAKQKRRHRKKQQLPIPSYLLFEDASKPYTAQPGDTWQVPSSWQSPSDPSLSTSSNNIQTNNSTYALSSSNNNNENPLEIYGAGHDIPSRGSINLSSNERPEFQRGSGPTGQTDRKLLILTYHQLMNNWHKELSSHSTHPYRTFSEAMGVPLFSIHLV
ncbi:5981_t:CDS:1 [Acaulospora morrowiae]|uniref:5981_t:CDS:1 n=1 Tax=Acaulospora morrowiae TaxID=94023 RepID=A0A9N8YN27_9GLOM|nr:5981_t:CDS:1 [Acaulospora morrowiae]